MRLARPVVVTLSLGPGFALPLILAASVSQAQSDAYFYALAFVLLAVGVVSTVGEGLGGRLHLEQPERRLRLCIPLVIFAAATMPGVAVAVVLALDQIPMWWLIAASFTLLPIVVAATSVLSGVAMAQGSHVKPLALQGLRGVGGLMAVLLVAGEEDLVPASAALGMVVGEVVRLAMLVDWTGPPTCAELPWRTTRAALPHVLAATIANGAPVLERTVAASLVVGSVTVIELADKALFAASIFATSLLVPQATQAWSAALRSSKDQRAMVQVWRKELRRAVRLGGTLTLAGVAGSCLLAPVLVSVGIDDPRVPLACALAFLSVIPVVVVALGSRMLAISGHTNVLPRVALRNLLVDVVWLAVLTPWLGVFGVVLSAVLMRTTAAVFYVRRIPRIYSDGGLRHRG